MEVFKKLTSHWVPDPEPRAPNSDHYKSYQDSCKNKTSEKYRPTLAPKLKKLPVSATAKERVRTAVRCSQCDKMRCIFSKTKLSQKELDLLKKSVEESLFTCGAEAVVGDSLEFSGIRENVYANPALTCSKDTERVYYSCELFDPICTYCGASVTDDEKKSRIDAEVAKGGNLLPKCSKGDCAELPFVGTRKKVAFNRKHRAEKRARIEEQKKAQKVSKKRKKAPKKRKSPPEEPEKRKKCKKRKTQKD
jgi:hypothetical protein